MSGHQPQRPFGPLYNPHIQSSSSPTVNYGMQRYPIQPPPAAYNGYWQGQSSPSGVQFPQSTNGFAHHFNAQTSVPPPFPTQAAPATYGGFPGIPQYSAAPTQFFSAPPTSVFPAAPLLHQPQINPNKNSYATISHPTPNQQAFQTIPPRNVEDVMPTQELGADLEDGELSGGEQEKSNDQVDENSRTSLEHSAPETVHVEDAQPKNLADREEPSKTVIQISELKPPFAEAYDNAQDHTKTLRSIRKQAEQILRELHSFNIGFEDIAKESFDVDLLRELFVEIGLPVPALKQQEPHHSSVEASKQVLRTKMGSHEQSEGTSNETLPSSDINTKNWGPNVVPDASGTMQPDGSPSMMPTSKNSAVHTQEPVASKNATKSSAAKPVDRQEYIARLKAAKIGKSTQSSEASLETPQATSETKITTSSADSIRTESRDNVSVTKPTSDHTDNASVFDDAQKDVTDLETKRKAQTDLALQKMEALRAQKKLQEETQSIKAKQKDIRPASLEVDIVDSASSIPTDEPRPVEDQPTPSDRRQTSYFSPVSLQPAFSIPGLFSAAQDASKDFRTERLEPTKASESNSAAEEGDSTDAGTGPRKRLKAADFMNLTPGTPQKSLSRDEDTGVVIDISDDEMENLDDFDPQSSSKVAQPYTSTAPSRQNQDSVFASPPGNNTPGKFQEPQELKMKENEIQSMNRKILELEQRIKAKQTASRIQSPRPPIAVSNSSATAPEFNGPSRSTPLHAESATEEQLIREKERQEDRLATAEAEQSQIANEKKQGNAKSRLLSQESIESTSIQPLHSNNNPKNSEDRLDSTNHLSKPTARQSISLQNELSKLDAEIANFQEGVHAAELERDRLNKELGLVKQEMERRHFELGEKAERRQLLQQQLADLSRSAAVTQESQIMPDGAIEMGMHSEDGNISEGGAIQDPPDSNLLQSETAGKDGLPLDKSIRASSRLSSREPSFEVGTDLTRVAVEPESPSARPLEQLHHYDLIDQPSDGELEEDIMDISGSDMDEGEGLEARRESTTKRDGNMDTSDDEDVYEPPSHVGSMQQHATVVFENQQQGLASELEPLANDASLGSLGGSINDEQMVEDTHPVQDQPDGVAKETNEEGLIREDGKDDEDYEPPEPEGSSLRDPDPPAHSSPSREAAMDELTEYSGNNQLPAAESALAGEHFVPYESPLKQFSSYRFHPDFRKEVDGGYRSLTYSNDIQPGVELCQYELNGGVCNDDSCTSQHFQKMALPDPIILAAMGKAEGTTPEEKNEYIKGLKSLIADLRERSTKDIDAIAEAIAQYRRHFLNDPSRILPL